MFLKCLNEKDFDIEKINKINMLSSVINYVTKFEYDYQTNLIKLCVKYTKLCLIEFMTLFNNLAYLISYLIQIKKTATF